MHARRISRRVGVWVAGELKTFFSVFFLKSNTDRNPKYAIFFGRGRGVFRVFRSVFPYWRRSGRINCHLYLKKAPSPLRFQAAASRKSRRPVQPLKFPLPVKRRHPFLLPLLLELLLRSTVLIMIMV